MSKCTVQLSYAIGISEPTSIYIDSFGTHRCDLELIERCIDAIFPLQPKHIVEKFGLHNPIYLSTASYGHFGNENYPWEVLDSLKIKILEAL